MLFSGGKGVHQQSHRSLCLALVECSCRSCCVPAAPNFNNRLGRGTQEGSSWWQLSLSAVGFCSSFTQQLIYPAALYSLHVWGLLSTEMCLLWSSVIYSSLQLTYTVSASRLMREGKPGMSQGIQKSLSAFSRCCYKP